MPDRVISVPQAQRIVQATKNQLDNVNGRLQQQTEAVNDLTMLPSEAEELLSIAKGEGDR